VMQMAARVAAAGFAEAADYLEPGVRETDVAAAAQAAFETTRGAEPFQRSYGYFFCMSGPNSAKAAAAYARTRQRVIEQGDLVMIHANTCADGYWTDLTRTYTAGNLRNGKAICVRRFAKHELPGCAPFGPGWRAGRWTMLCDRLWKSMVWEKHSSMPLATEWVLPRQTPMAGREFTPLRPMCSKRA
jgi:hypothetical protein